MTTIEQIKEELKRRIEDHKSFERLGLYIVPHWITQHVTDLCLLSAIESLEEIEATLPFYNINHVTDKAFLKITRTWEESC